MKRRMFCLCVALAFASAGLVWSWGMLRIATADDAHKSNLYNSAGFEREPFQEGAQLLGLDGWTTAIPPFLNPAAATITGADSLSGRYSVEVRGADLIGSGGITAPYDAVGSYRLPLGPSGIGHAVSAKKLLVVSADLLLQTDEAATADDFFTMNLAARSGDGATLGEMGLSSSGEAVAYGFNAAPGDEPAFLAPIEFNQWHEVSIVMDFSEETTVVAYYLDGELVGAMPTTSTSDVLLRGAMVVYFLPDGDSQRSDYTARFDNFRITAHHAD